MEKQRSPNYPSLSLREAVERVRALHSQIGQNAHPRDVVAQAMGYRGLSGASGSTISALKKYGLLAGRGEDICVSDRAMAILHPHSEAERQEALKSAAAEPEIFRDLASKFPDTRTNDDLIKNYLLRNKYPPKIVDAVLAAYRETIEFTGGLRPAPETSLVELSSVVPQANLSIPARLSPVMPTISIADEVIEIGGIGFKGIGFVKIMASQELPLEKALSMAEQIIKMMRIELDQDRS